MKFILSSLILYSLLTVVSANPTKTSRRPTSDKDCQKEEFFYPLKSCCLPHGGPTKTPSPPPQKQCPPTNWYWDHDTSCCVPKHAPPPNPPPPQCNKQWEWDNDSQCCEPQAPSKAAPPRPSISQSPHKPSTSQSPHKPSTSQSPHKYQIAKGAHRHPKRHVLKSREITSCPQGLEACPMGALLTTNGRSDYECVDTFSGLTSCGGCVSTGAGRDCGAIKGAWNVGCEFGTCKVYTCAGGYKKAHDELSCLLL